MATLPSITIPDDQAQLVLDAFCAYYGYDPNSGITKIQFVKQQLVKHIISVVKTYKADMAVAAIPTTRQARQQAAAQIDATLTIS